MIRVLMTADTGIVLVIGIVEENVRIMRDGRPLHLDLGGFLKEGYGPAPERMPENGMLHLMVYYGRTHVAIIDRLASEAAGRGIDFTRYRKAAERLDAQLREEGRL